MDQKRRIINRASKKTNEKVSRVQKTFDKYCETTRNPSKMDFIDYLTFLYLDKREYYDKSTILYQNIDDPNEKLYVKPTLKYTEKYDKQVLYKIYPLRNLKLNSFLTITTKAADDLQEWHYQMQNGIRPTWKASLDKLKDMGLRKLEILRTYELTKKFTLHGHVAIFSELKKEELQKLCEYYDRKFGLQKAYFFENHQKKKFRNKKTGRFEIGMEAEVLESWIHDGKCLEKKICLKKGARNHVEGKFEWINIGKERIDRTMINYLVKYMVKLPSKEHQAVLRAYNVRTYDPSKALRSRLAKIAKPLSEKNWVKIGILDDTTKEGRYLNGEKITKEQRIYEKPRSEKLERYLDSIGSRADPTASQ